MGEEKAGECDEEGFMSAEARMTSIKCGESTQKKRRLERFVIIFEQINRIPLSSTRTSANLGGLVGLPRTK